MSGTEKTAGIEKRRGLSLDAWAVVAALLAALLIRAGVVPRVPW